MPMLPAVPPVASAPAVQSLPPLSFAGFRAHMPMPDARALISSAGGSLVCKPTTDPRMRECTGSMPRQALGVPVRVLISSVRDSAAVIVLSGSPGGTLSAGWVDSLTRVFGTPNQERQLGVRGSWQWIRRGQMLRVILRGTGAGSETAVTLTDGPLLDGLGPLPTRRPD